MLARIKSSLSIATRPEQPEEPPKNIRPRQSRRLSKPQTNRTSFRQSMLGDENDDEEGGAETQTINSLTVEFAHGTDGAVKKATREALRYQLFGSPADTHPPPDSFQFIPSQDSERSGPNHDAQPFRKSRLSLNLKVGRTNSMPVGPMSPVNGIDHENAQDTRHASLLSSPVLSSSPKMYGPIRRSSLLTPGVATRFSRTDFEEMDYDNAKRTSVVQSQGWEEVAADVDLDVFEWQLPKFVERASTPSDLDVPHIGTIDLGALRITNGCPSPVPSDSATVHSRQLSGGLERLERRDDRTSAAATLASSMLRREVKEPTISDTPRSVNQQDVTVEKYGPSEFPEAPTRPPPPPPIRLDDSAIVAQDSVFELSPSGVEHYQRSHSPHLEVTTKATELEDNLFEDEVIGQPSPESISTPSSHLQVIPDTRPAASRTSTERSLGKSDSGYSSSSSVHSARETRKAKMKQYLQNQHNLSISALTTGNQETARLPEESPATETTHPCELQAGAALLSPRVAEVVGMNESTQSFATYDSSMSQNTLQKSRARRLQKKRPCLDSRTPSSITVQSQDNVTHFDVPPVPAHISRTLSERVLSLPVLDRTYSNANKEDRSDDDGVRRHDFQSVEIKFPSPLDSDLESTSKPSKVKSSTSRPTLYKRLSSSILGLSKSSKRGTLPGECDQETAVSIIQNSESLFHPGEARFRRVLPGSRPLPVQRHSFAGVSHFAGLPPIEDEETDRTGRPTTMGMDAQTAAQLARTRSKSLVDRHMDALHAQNSGFNDRGGIPGRRLRPISAAIDAPPLPPLPNNLGRYHPARMSYDGFSQVKSRPKSSTPQGASFASRMNGNSSHTSMTSNETQPQDFRSSLPPPDRRPPPPPVHRSSITPISTANPDRTASPAPTLNITRPKSTIGVRTLPEFQRSTRDESQSRFSSVTGQYGWDGVTGSASGRVRTPDSVSSRPPMKVRRSISQQSNSERSLRPGSSDTNNSIYYQPPLRMSGGYHRSGIQPHAVYPVAADWQSVY